ncbi:hypothetical protein A2U01_0036455, partial [Trifolium medium]|nr:hypothetical protein [Trifolium medium]
GEPSNLHDVEIIPEPLNTQHNRQTPQFTTQASIPTNNIFSSIHASLSPDRNHQTLPLQNTQPQNTTENHIPNQPQDSQEQQTNDMFSTKLTLLQQQARRTGQRGPQTEAIVNTNGNNAQVNKETSIVGPNGTRNTNGLGNGNRGNNGNGRRGRNSPKPHSSDNGSSRDHPYEDERRRYWCFWCWQQFCKNIF